MILDRKNTIFCDRIPKMKMNDLLGEIFKRLGLFNNFYGYCPENILLSANDYFRIQKERPDVIIKKDNNYYILGMKIVC